MSNISSWGSRENEIDLSAYLFVYFTGNTPEKERLHYGVSRNGYDFRVLNAGKPIPIPELGTGCIRDPFLIQGEDGFYYIIATDMMSSLGWESNHAMVIYKTADLIHILDCNRIDYHNFGTTSNCNRVWAPQAIWCPEKNSYMIYVTIQNPEDGNGTIMWRHFATDLMDWKTYTEPEIMLMPGEGEESVIDGDIIYDPVNHRYIMYYNGKNLAVAASLSGEFSSVDPETGNRYGALPFYTSDGKEMLVEGSNIFKRIGAQQWLILADGTSFNGGGYAFAETTDFINYHQLRNDEFLFDFLPRHGYVIPIKEQQLQLLVEAFGEVELTERTASRHTLTVNAKGRGADISNHMIGLFFEDINSAADGGIYSEMINNRSFEAYHASGKGAGQRLTTFEPIPGHGWNLINGAKSFFYSERPLNENNTTYLHLIAYSGGDGIANDCNGGFSASSGEKFTISLYARGSYKGTLTIAITEGNQVLDSVTFQDFNNDFCKYTSTITMKRDVEVANVILIMSEKGELELDMVSVMSQNTYNGRENGLRKDVIEMLRDMHPGFLRFPGGCIVEGYDLNNRYQWKHTIGPVEERKQNWNRWQVHDNGSGRYGYCQTYGLGFYEYFLLCEDLACEPLPVLNCGMACQFQSKELAAWKDISDTYIQDALDLIEFANGSTDSVWGAKRAQMGHPEPFCLKYLAIGNEQWEKDYFERYELFAEALKQRYPEIKLITSSGPFSTGDYFNKAWSWLEGKDRSFADLVDEHYYMPPQWFYDNTDRYDNYDRSRQAVFAGEYAAHARGTCSNNMEAALSEAAFLPGLIKNSDVVRLASYAPLFAKEGSIQWKPDLVWFDRGSSYGTPSYYVQSIYSNHLGSYNLPIQWSGDQGLYQVVTFEECSGDILIKLVNPNSVNAKLDLQIEGVDFIDSCAEMITLSGFFSDVNTRKSPMRIHPQKSVLLDMGTYSQIEILPRSFVALRIHTVKEYAVSVEKIRIMIPIGTNVNCPESVLVHFGNGISSKRQVNWNLPRGNAYCYPGTYVIHGKVEGTALYAKAEIIVG